MWLPLALHGPTLVAKLHESDLEYRDQLQRAAVNARSLATDLGETRIAESVERRFGEQIAAFESAG